VPLELEKSSFKTLLGQRVAEGINDSRALAATVVFQRPAELEDVEVREFLGWIQGSNVWLVNEYMRAAMIGADAKLGELSAHQRAGLIALLRFRRRIAR
jgi:hypothetical protein